MSPDVRQLLAAINEALDVPVPAGIDDATERAYTRLLDNRVAWVRGVLQGAADGEPASVTATVDALRQATTRLPVTYAAHQPPA